MRRLFLKISRATAFIAAGFFTVMAMPIVSAQTNPAAPQQAQLATAGPAPKEGDFAVKDFRFDSGEVLPQMKLHYTTLGAPRPGTCHLAWRPRL